MCVERKGGKRGIAEQEADQRDERVTKKGGKTVMRCANKI